MQNQVIATEGFNKIDEDGDVVSLIKVIRIFSYQKNDDFDNDTISGNEEPEK